jgi:hypothetical protein
MADADMPRLVTARPDVEIAAEIKAEALAAMEGVCAVAAKARSAGLWLQAGFTVDQFGRFVPTAQVVKHFT